MDLERRGGWRRRCDHVWRLRFRGAGLGSPGFGDGFGANGRLFASRFIDMTTGLGLTRGGFQGALARGEFALRQVQIACGARAARPCRWRRRRALAAAGLCSAAGRA